MDLDQLLDMSSDDLLDLFHARARRRLQRGLKRKPLALIKKLRKAKKEATGDKPAPVRTHLRSMLVMPEMIGSLIGVYNGKTFNQVRRPACGQAGIHLWASCHAWLRDRVTDMPCVPGRAVPCRPGKATLPGMGKLLVVSRQCACRCKHEPQAAQHSSKAAGRTGVACAQRGCWPGHRGWNRPPPALPPSPRLLCIST